MGGRRDTRGLTQRLGRRQRRRMDGPAYGVAEAAGPGVARVLARNPGPMTFTGTGTLIVGTGGDVAVVDPGPDDADHLAALLRAVGQRRVRAILVTHNHLDHSPLACALRQATGAPVMGAAPLAAAQGGGEGFERAYAPDHVLADAETVAGDGWALTALHTPGHTSNHLCFALADGPLLSGDHVMGWSTTVVVPPDGSMGAYMASLDRLSTRPEAMYLPTHGLAIERPHAHVRGLILHRRQREAQLLALLGEGAAAVDALVARAYAQVDRRLWPAAAKSVEAHMIHMAERGLTRADGPLWHKV